MIAGKRTGLIFFAIFWTLGVGVFVCFWLYAFTNQLRTLTFHTADGQIDTIEKTVNQGSDNDTYGITVQYHFMVNGIRYTSDRLRFGAMSSDDNWADTMLRRFPQGQPVSVYFNPRNPAESVLLRGPEGMDIYLFLFLTPFVGAGIIVWYSVLRSVDRSRQFRGLTIIESDACTILRPAMTRPLVIAGAVFGGGAFVSVFALGFTVGGRPSLALTLGVVATLILAAAIFGGISAIRIRSGQRDLIIDDHARQLLLPGGQAIAFSALAEVRIEDNPRIQVNDHPIHNVSIYFNASNAPAHHAVKWTSDLDRARQLAAYLALRLHIPAMEGRQPLLPQNPAPVA